MLLSTTQCQTGMIPYESGVTFGEFNSVTGSETVQTQRIFIQARNGCEFDIYRHPGQAVTHDGTQYPDQLRERWAEPIHTTTPTPRDNEKERELLSENKIPERMLLRSLMQNSSNELRIKEHHKIPTRKHESIMSLEWTGRVSLQNDAEKIPT